MILGIMPIFLGGNGGGSVPPNKLIAILIVVNFFILLFWVTRSIIFYFKKKPVTDEYRDETTYFQYVFWKEYDISTQFASMTFIFANGIAILFSSAEFVSKFIK